ncbi:hypothetical protein NQZ79_g4625 [Umbelopsis isabellina]|nr:hypothetical protein NQZ79_g4625 [Umbelopsis isabellina]
MNWNGGIKTNVRFKCSNDKQAQKNFFNRQRILRSQRVLRVGHPDLAIHDSLVRAALITENIPVDHQTRYQCNKLEQKVNEFQAAALLQKCQHVNERDSEAERLHQASQLLYKATKLSKQMSSASSMSKDSSSYGEKLEPLFDIDASVTNSFATGEKINPALAAKQ